MPDNRLPQVMAAAEKVLLEGLSDDQVLEFAEEYSKVVQSFVESGEMLPESESASVLAVHKNVIGCVEAASGRSFGCGQRRTAVKAYLAAFGLRFGEGRS